MKYEPKELYNPTNKTIEFMYDNAPYIVEPNEVRLFDGVVADHALNWVNTGLVEYQGQKKKAEPKTTKPIKDLEKMSWNELRTKASELGVYQVGMRSEEVIEAIRNA